MDMLLKAKDWVMARVGERTSLDGLLLIGGCLSVILFGGLAKIAAWVGLGWGVYTLVKSD